MVSLPFEFGQKVNGSENYGDLELTERETTEERENRLLFNAAFPDNLGKKVKGKHDQKNAVFIRSHHILAKRVFC
jgi:hypothetical protein